MYAKTEQSAPTAILPKVQMLLIKQSLTRSVIPRSLNNLHVSFAALT